MSLPVQCRLTVIGQAKRYAEKPIAEKAMREFVGASVLERHSLRVGQNTAPLTPTLLAFWSTSSFDANCKTFARKAGVWLMDGHTLASYVDRLGLSEWILSLKEV